MILIIEDEETLRSVVEVFLQENGFPVLTTGDGLEAVRLFQEHRDEIRIVFSDVELPGIDGREAFFQMKRIRPDVRAIFASGHLNNAVKAQLQLEGVKHFLQKPYTGDQVIEAILQILHEEKCL